MSTRIASVRACPEHTSDRLQNGPIQLFGIDPQPAGICLDEGDQAHELPVSLSFLMTVAEALPSGEVLLSPASQVL